MFPDVVATYQLAVFATLAMSHALPVVLHVVIDVQFVIAIHASAVQNV